MHKGFFPEIVTSVMLFLLLIVLMDPLHSFMLTSMQMVVLCICIVVFGIYGVFIMRSHPRDEREQFHAFFAARLSHLVGATILLIGITIEKIQHRSPGWLLLALAGMVIAKGIGFFYAQRRH